MNWPTVFEKISQIDWRWACDDVQNTPLIVGDRVSTHDGSPAKVSDGTQGVIVRIVNSGYREVGGRGVVGPMLNTASAYHGKVCFLRGKIPDKIVTIEITTNKEKFAVARVVGAIL